MKIFSVVLLLSILLAPFADDKIRVFITCSNCGNYIPEAEAVKGFRKHCKEVTVTLNKEKANYVVVSDYTGAGLLRNPYKVAIFGQDGDAIHGSDTKTLKGMVKAACKAIRKDIADRAANK